MTKKEQKSLEEALALMSELYMTEKVNAERLEKALTAMEKDRDRILASTIAERLCLDDIAAALHGWKEGERHAYVPSQLAGMVRDLVQRSNP